MSGGKAYGLTVPKKGPLQPRLSVFGDEDSPDEAGAETARPPPRRAKAAAELDGELLRYDEYHDELERERAQQRQARREGAAQARYIPLLLQQAERRKKEAERRTERLVHKEREAEGDQFRDKDTFVTASYRRKVEEFARMDAEDRRQDRLEELADVTKQQDISAFYGSLYRQTVDVRVKEEPEDEQLAAGKKSRHYRKRRDSSGEEPDEDAAGDAPAARQAVAPERSRSSKRKKRGDDVAVRPEEDSRDENHAGVEDAARKLAESGSEEGEIREEEDARGTAGAEPPVQESSEAASAPEPSPKVDIWEKRTVGEVFEAAVQRYWQRKAARGVTK